MSKELQGNSLEETGTSHVLPDTSNQVEIKKDAYSRQSSNSRPSKEAYKTPGTGPQYYNFSFFPRTIKEWNRLPQETVEVNS